MKGQNFNDMIKGDDNITKSNKRFLKEYLKDFNNKCKNKSNRNKLLFKIVSDHHRAVFGEDIHIIARKRALDNIHQ